MQVTGPTNYTSSTIVEPAIQTTVGIRLSARQLLVFVFFLIIFTGAARPITDPDFWWHLRTGQYLLETRTIPHTDIFSSLHFGKEWVTHEWLSEIIMFAVYRVAGYLGLILTFSLVITVAFLVVYNRYKQRVDHPYIACFALLLGAFATMPTWGVRPQMFSLLFASILLAIIENYLHGGPKERLYWLAPLTICWANMHAGFALGLALIGLTILGLLLDGWLTATESRRELFGKARFMSLILVMCFFSVVVNPNGIRLYSYPFETLRSPAMMKYISEWWSPNFHEPMFLAFALLIFATFVSLVLARKQVRLRDLLLFSATGIAALRSARNIPFFALVAIPLLAESAWGYASSQSWGQWLTRPEKLESASLKIALNIGLLVMVPLGIAGIRVGQSATKQAAVSSQEFPAAAVDFMVSRKLPQPVYNEYGWGGYMIWRLYPEYRVYIDGRADVYGDAFLEEFLMVHSGEPGWREPLNRLGVRTVLVKPDTALASLLRQDAQWDKVFEDSQAVIFTTK
jgi:hypothetical protein